jgi:hypothetical protein
MIDKKNRFFGIPSTGSISFFLSAMIFRAE